MLHGLLVWYEYGTRYICTSQNSLWPIDWTLNHYGRGILFLRTNLRVSTKNWWTQNVRQSVCTSLHSTAGGTVRAGWFFVNSVGSQYLTFFSVENVPCSTGWTLTHYASFCIAIAAAFPRFWGLVELDLSPRDSPKGLCNISRDPEGGYCGRTSGQRYLTYSGPKWILSCTTRWSDTMGTSATRLLTRLIFPP